jgi:putative glycosyltransferase (TIGR04372 family)
MFFAKIRPYLYRGKVFTFVAAKFLVVLPLLPALALLYLCEPFWRIRFCHVGSVKRIGALAVIPDYYFRLWDREGRPRRTTLIFVMHSPDNRPLMRMWKRRIVVWESLAADWILTAMAPLFRLTRFNDDNWRKYHSPKLYGPQVFLSFTSDEEKKGKSFLQSMGIKPDDWFMCFHSREPEYYDQIEVPEFEKRIHAHRNSDPASYLKAAEIVAERGGFSIRMGAGVVKRLPDERSPRIIDYACDNYDAFADIYLSARCKFFLGNTAGIIALPSIFRRPTAIANQLPPSGTPLGPDDPWTPMLTRHLPSNKLLSFREMWEVGLFSSDLTSEKIAAIVARENLSWEQNTSDEIADLCLDTFDVVEDRQCSREARELQEYFRKRFHGHFDDWESRPFISARFALRHAALIAG